MADPTFDEDSERLAAELLPDYSQVETHFDQKSEPLAAQLLPDHSQFEVARPSPLAQEPRAAQRPQAASLVELSSKNARSDTDLKDTLRELAAVVQSQSKALLALQKSEAELQAREVAFETHALEKPGDRPRDYLALPSCSDYDKNNVGPVENTMSCDFACSAEGFKPGFYASGLNGGHCCCIAEQTGNTAQTRMFICKGYASRTTFSMLGLLVAIFAMH